MASQWSIFRQRLSYKTRSFFAQTRDFFLLRANPSYQLKYLTTSCIASGMCTSVFLQLILVNVVASKMGPSHSSTFYQILFRGFDLLVVLIVGVYALYRRKHQLYSRSIVYLPKNTLGMLAFGVMYVLGAFGSFFCLVIQGLTKLFVHLRHAIQASRANPSLKPSKPSLLERMHMHFEAKNAAFLKEHPEEAAMMEKRLLNKACDSPLNHSPKTRL